MATTVLLIRNAETLWHQQGRVLGRRDIGLIPEGKQQAIQTLNLISHLEVNEILSSPLTRAVQTAEVFAQHYGLGVGRDPRLIELDMGQWEGESWRDLTPRSEFQDLATGTMDSIPKGESLNNALKRTLTSLEESVVDNPQSASIILVTHSPIIRLILAHYLGMPLHYFLRLNVHHCSISLLCFPNEFMQPEITGINLAIPLPKILAESTH